MREIKIISICLIILFVTENFSAQTVSPSDRSDANPIPDWVYNNQRNRDQINSQADKDKNGMIANRDIRPAVPKISEEKLKEIKERVKQYEESMKLLQPPSSYFDQFKNLLKAKNTGLARLFDDKKCGEQKMVVSVQEAERCAGVPMIKGNGSLYSFNSKFYNKAKKGTALPDEWWDIHFINGKFVVGNCCAQGIISDIGDVSKSN